MGLIEISPRIETRRLLLRAPRFQDAGAIAAYAGDPAISRMTARMPHPYALADAEDWIGHTAGHDPDQETAFVIEDDDGDLVGSISLFRGHEGLDEVGYWIGRPFWGRGFATEALSALVGWACGEKRRRVVTAARYEDNPASGAVLAKAGFLYTGVRSPLFSRARGEEAITRRMVRLA